jgi:hypothetical protein
MQRRALFLTMTLAWTLAGCAEPPRAAVDAGRQALDGARSAGAGTYAAESLRAAEDAAAGLDAELKAQEQKAAFMRSYKKATELAEAAQLAAQKVVADAESGKQKSKQEAGVAIEATRQAVGRAKDAVEQLPRTKAAQGARQAIGGDIAAAETALVDAESALAAERLADAKAKAEAAGASVAKAQVALDGALKPPAKSGR